MRQTHSEYHALKQKERASDFLKGMGVGERRRAHILDLLPIDKTNSF